jgi:hypothetical protein
MSPLLGHRPSLWITHEKTAMTTRAQYGLVGANNLIGIWGLKKERKKKILYTAHLSKYIKKRNDNIKVKKKKNDNGTMIH